MKGREWERQEGGWRVIREEDEAGGRLRGGKQGNRAVVVERNSCGRRGRMGRERRAGGNSE